MPVISHTSFIVTCLKPFSAKSVYDSCMIDSLVLSPFVAMIILSLSTRVSIFILDTRVEIVNILLINRAANAYFASAALIYQASTHDMVFRNLVFTESRIWYRFDETACGILNILVVKFFTLTFTAFKLINNILDKHHVYKQR